MMKRLIIFSVIGFCIISLLPNSVKGAMPDPDIEIIRKRVTADIMKPVVNEALINNLMSSIQADGTWPGINYTDVSNTGFQHADHLRNMVELSRAYKKAGSKFKSDKKLKAVIYSSLDYWLKNDFICQNWWWNQIGTPDQLVRVLLIMDTDLTKEQIDKTLPMVGRANLSASGARPSGDRIKIAGILAKNALFNHDVNLFNETLKVIIGEIKFATGRGMQYDYSFHHRTDRVTSTLSYGTGYADAFAEWTVLVAGTTYSFPEKPMNQLIDYYLDGICKTMVYGKYPDPGAENRSITREGDLHPVGPLTPERLLTASSYRKDELEKIILIRKGLAKPDLSFNRFYWDSEYFSHQRPSFFASVRMFSSRNNNMEMPYNSEGLMNHHYADGSNFISRTGKEYLNISPVFDWQKIPGTTVVQKPSLPSENEIQKEGLTDFVGAVTDGLYGAASFDFRSPHDPLKAKKAWFFFDKEYVCLGAGISAGTNLSVATTLNQCLLRGTVVAMSGNSKSVLQHGEWQLDKVKWILHDSVGYLFPEPVNINLSNQPATGSWYKINHQSDSPKEEITKDVFKLWLDHGKRPDSASYQYIVVPSVGEQEMSSTIGNRGVVILTNNTDIQAVKHLDLSICQIVFYKSGEIQITPSIRIGSESPGMVMVKTEGETVKRITVSDPTRKLAKIHLSVTSRIEKKENHFKAAWDESKGISEVTIDLPQDVYAGKSVTIEF
jgi:chondroitin AC lyase